MTTYLFARRFNDQHGTFVEKFFIENEFSIEQACKKMHDEILSSTSFFIPLDILFQFAQKHDGAFYFRDEHYIFVMVPLPSVEAIYDHFHSIFNPAPFFRRPSKIDLEVDSSFDESFD